MKRIDADSLASITFSARWRNNGTIHTDAYYAQRVNFWRDILPSSMQEGLMTARAGDTVEIEIPADAVIPPYNDRKIKSLNASQFDPSHVSGQSVIPRFGRFYPQGMLKGVSGVYKENMTPFRCIGITKRGLVGDLNHPLAGRELVLTADVHDVREKFEERGGTVYDWAEIALSGAGMQDRWRKQPTDFFEDHSFDRADGAADADFYSRPRMVNHIDDVAIDHIRQLYSRLLKPGTQVLDLMSSWTSHLPENLELERVAGLGMNAEELAANSRLSDYQVHDLNRFPRLPYSDREFEAVICTVSVEYMTQPLYVFEDVRRILKPGGVFVLTFSNRWFPPKAVRIWTMLHEFERMGLVLEYFYRTGGYANFETYSISGFPRPEHDRYYPRIKAADPVFAVWGYKA